MSRNMENVEEIDRRLGGIRRKIHESNRKGFLPRKNSAVYRVTPDGPINVDDLCKLAEGWVSEDSLACRLSVMYDGTPSEQRRLLDHWEDDDVALDVSDRIDRRIGEKVRSFTFGWSSQWDELR